MLPSQIIETLFNIIETKFTTLERDNMQRIFHGRGCLYPHLEQLTVDWLDHQLFISLFKPHDEEFISALKAKLTQFAHSNLWQKSLGKGIAIFHRYQKDQALEVVAGQIQTHGIGIENGLKYHLSFGKNQNIGIFLDMENGRTWVREHAKDKKILNLFAYTCGFSVAAIAGGASQVVNVDMAKAVLATGRENHRLNELDVSKVKFLAHDILKSWGKLTKLGPYDLVIIDPPSFQKGSFALTTDYKKILRRLNALTVDEGQVLACVNSPAIDERFLIDLMQVEAPEFSFVHRLENPEVFADIDPQASLKVLLFEKRESN